MEGFCRSMLAGAATCRIRPPFNSRKGSDFSSMSFRCRNPLFGGLPSQWSPMGSDTSPSKVWVASDHSDSVPNSSNFRGRQGYHPLEDIKGNDKGREKLLTEAEIARTTVEANNGAILIFPGMVHSEPHRHMSWAEFDYIIDDYGDIFFEIFDNENILKDRGASNPVNVLIGMDLPTYGNNEMVTTSYLDSLDYSSSHNILTDALGKETDDTEASSTLIDWGTSDTMWHIHPMYFAKCLAKVVLTKYLRKMDHPSNGLSITGCLRPALIDEESYLRRLIYSEDSDGYMSDWKDTRESEKDKKQMHDAYSLVGDLNDGETMKFDSSYGGHVSSTLYKLDVMKIKLFSVYGHQSLVSLQDFQNAEPDILVHSASVIIEHFSGMRMKCDAALKALCRKKKGLSVEGAVLIGVDSLGMDVRAFSGLEAKTLRFSFNAPVTSESAAEKKIKRMLFPRYHRKSLKPQRDGLRDLDYY